MRKRLVKQGGQDGFCYDPYKTDDEIQTENAETRTRWAVADQALLIAAEEKSRKQLSHNRMQSLRNVAVTEWVLREKKLRNAVFEAARFSMMIITALQQADQVESFILTSLESYLIQCSLVFIASAEMVGRARITADSKREMAVTMGQCRLLSSQMSQRTKINTYSEREFNKLSKQFYQEKTKVLFFLLGRLEKEEVNARNILMQKASSEGIVRLWVYQSFAIEDVSARYLAIFGAKKTALLNAIDQFLLPVFAPCDAIDQYCRFHNVILTLLRKIAVAKDFQHKCNSLLVFHFYIYLAIEHLTQVTADMDELIKNRITDQQAQQPFYDALAVSDQFLYDLAVVCPEECSPVFKTRLKNDPVLSDIIKLLTDLAIFSEVILYKVGYLSNETSPPENSVSTRRIIIATAQKLEKRINDAGYLLFQLVSGSLAFDVCRQDLAQQNQKKYGEFVDVFKSVSSVFTDFSLLCKKEPEFNGVWALQLAEIIAELQKEIPRPKETANPLRLR